MKIIFFKNMLPIRFSSKLSITFPIEGVHLLFHPVGSAVGSVVAQSTSLLQLLPHGPDLVHESVVYVEHGVVGRVFQGRQSEDLTTANKVVDSVVEHFILDLRETRFCNCEQKDEKIHSVINKKELDPLGFGLD